MFTSIGYVSKTANFSKSSIQGVTQASHAACAFLFGRKQRFQNQKNCVKTNHEQSEPWRAKNVININKFI